MKHSYSDGIITIRPWLENDVDGLFEAVRESIDSISTWLPWCHPNYSIGESRSWIQTRPQSWETGEEYSFAVLDAESNRLLGGVGINQVNRIHNYANLGYWIRITAQKRGAAARAAVLAARFGFTGLHFERLEVLAAEKNIASQKVAAKAGAAREGLLKHRLKIGNQYHNAVIFSLIKSEFLDDHQD